MDDVLVIIVILLITHVIPITIINVVIDVIIIIAILVVTDVVVITITDVVITTIIDVVNLFTIVNVASSSPSSSLS